MRSSLNPICWWFKKKPSETCKTEEIDQALEDLKDLNRKTTERLKNVDQPDILRSLVISMNAGRNR